MPLILQNNNLTGVFQGQGNNPVRIGTVSGRPNNDASSPFVCGCYQGEDSIQMNVYFDPAASKKLDINQTYAKIGIIQIGRLQLNHLYLPYDFYQIDSLYPDTVDYARMNSAKYPGATEWLDTPWQKSNGEKNIDPTFPAWNYADSARTPIKTMFQYPNNYGGYVRYQHLAPYNYQHGENLCAYIQSNLVINMGNSPYFLMKLELMDFLDSIDPDGYILSNTQIPSVNFKDRPDLLSVVVDALNKKGIIPFNSQHNFFFIPDSFGQGNLGTFRDYGNSKIRYIVSSTRLYIEYYPGVLVPKNEEPERIVLIPINGTFHYFNYSEDFNEDFNDARAQSGPDIPAIFNNIKSKYGFVSTPKQDLQLTYQMYTCACSITFNLNRVFVQLFEGFSWDISREFTKSTGWNNLQLTLPPSADSILCNARKYGLQFALEKYYPKAYDRTDIKVEFT